MLLNSLRIPDIAVKSEHLKNPTHRPALLADWELIPLPALIVDFGDRGVSVAAASLQTIADDVVYDVTATDGARLLVHARTGEILTPIDAAVLNALQTWTVYLAVPPQRPSYSTSRIQSTVARPRFGGFHTTTKIAHESTSHRLQERSSDVPIACGACTTSSGCFTSWTTTNAGTTTTGY